MTIEGGVSSVLYEGRPHARRHLAIFALPRVLYRKWAQRSNRKPNALVGGEARLATPILLRIRAPWNALPSKKIWLAAENAAAREANGVVRIPPLSGSRGSPDRISSPAGSLWHGNLRRAQRCYEGPPVPEMGDVRRSSDGRGLDQEALDGPAVDECQRPN